VPQLHLGADHHCVWDDGLDIVIDVANLGGGYKTFLLLRAARGS
jgi:hypothetical protein